MVLSHLQRRPPGWLGFLKRDRERRGFEEAALRAAILLGAAGASPVAPTAPAGPGPVTRPRWASLQASTALSSPAGSAARPLRGDRAAPALRAAIHRDRVTSARAWRSAGGGPVVGVGQDGARGPPRGWRDGLVAGGRGAPSPGLSLRRAPHGGLPDTPTAALRWSTSHPCFGAHLSDRQRCGSRKRVRARPIRVPSRPATMLRGRQLRSAADEPDRNGRFTPMDESDTIVGKPLAGRGL